MPIAGDRVPVTLERVPRNGIAARKQAELKNRRLRGVGPGRPPIAPAAPVRSGERETAATGVLHRIIDVPAPAPPTRRVVMRTLDGGGRFRLDVVSELGWEPGVMLAMRFDGPWLVAAPGPGEARSSLRVTFDRSQRLCIPHGLRARLGVDTGVGADKPAD